MALKDLFQRRRGPGRPKGSKNKQRPVLTPLLAGDLTQDEIDALADFAVGYPLEEATKPELLAFRRGLQKIEVRRSRRAAEEVETP